MKEDKEDLGNDRDKMTFGQMIGVRSHTCKVSQCKGGPNTSITVKIDYTTTNNQDIISWLNSNRIIAGQRPWRDLSVEEVKGLDGKTFLAQSIGQKVKSREDKVEALVSAGLPRKLAEFSIDNPQAFEKVVKDIDVK